jgi:hypothetical protein
MKTPIWILALATTLAATSSAAQETSGGGLATVLQSIFGLPKATQEARVLGVPESDLRVVLDTAREKRLPAGVVAEMIRDENDAIRENGPIDNFGAFVQARLNEGLRGRDLAAAIRAEHVAHGKGKGQGLSRSSAPAGSPGKSGSAGKPGSPGKSEAAQKDKAAKSKKGGPQ